MQKKSFITGLALVFIVVGCSSSSGILPAGPDTYTVTERISPFLGGGTKAEHIALTEANKFCEDHGRKLLPMSRDESGDHTQWGTTGYSVTFHCYLPSDPRMTHAEYGQSSGTENQNPPKNP